MEVDVGPAVYGGGPRSSSAITRRYRPAVPFVVVGSVAVVAGGLVAAVSRPTDFGHGPWLAAFLVLVAGVVQIVLGAGQSWLADQPMAAGPVRLELVSWNLSVLTTVVGTLVDAPVLTTVGGVLMIVALALFLRGVRAAASAPRWAITTYRVLVGIVLVSTPVGLALAWVRTG